MKLQSGNITKYTKLTLSSLLICSRSSQKRWLHYIPPDDSVDSIQPHFPTHCTPVRCSLTFRHIAPQFKNSLFVCGDSNTWFLKFGEGAGTFGKWLPGICHESTTISKVPSPELIGPYKNVLIHMGINDIKQSHHPCIPELVHQLECKCASIHKMYPNTKIFLSALLPTKKIILNKKVDEFNRCLYQLSRMHPNLIFIENDTFWDSGTVGYHKEIGENLTILKCIN